MIETRPLNWLNLWTEEYCWDLGYEGPSLAQLLAEESELLITRRDAPDKRELHSSVRLGIETLFKVSFGKSL